MNYTGRLYVQLNSSVESALNRGWTSKMFLYCIVCVDAMLLCICQERNVSCLCSALQEAGIQAEPWGLALLLLLGRDVVAVNWAGGVTLAWNACRFSSAVAFWSTERYSRRDETIKPSHTRRESRCRLWDCFVGSNPKKVLNATYNNRVASSYLLCICCRLCGAEIVDHPPGVCIFVMKKRRVN